uniref:Uncharacterized protein n=1 Tax=candidate division WOR-3 bacterium TaxID=2052148 RepID=A0A7C2PLG9_UNCW3
MKVLKYVITGIMAFGFIANPIVLNAAQSEEIANACRQAEFDAQRDVNGTLWLGAGCLFGLLGVGAAYIFEPSPPASRLLGKSPEYVASYTDCYKAAAKKIQTNNAIKGCVISGVLYIAWYVVWMLIGIASTSAAY